MNTYRLLIAGSRDWSDRESIRSAMLEALWEAGPRPVRVVHGGCPTGADAIAADIASRYGCEVESHPADWGKHGKAAGPIRNQEMVGAGADLCLAFMLPESRGTRDCVRRARAAGIPVLVTHGQATQ